MHEQNSGQVNHAGVGSHVTVLGQEAVELLSLSKGDIVVDATAGEGGHSERIASVAGVTLISLDADPAAVAHTRERLATFGDRVQVVEANFSTIGTVLEGLGKPMVNKVLFDLGWNRGQLTSGRGFSFREDEPLNMSYGTVPASGFTAAELLNTWSETVLADVIFGYGEERYARRIAKHIVEARETKPFLTTFDLVEAVAASVPALYRKSRLHFATRTFQAIRIAVNNELGVLEEGLKSAWDHLSPGGRISVITFHSIEDRVVKRYFAQLVKEEEGTLTTKKPITPSDTELHQNPASRSAKLRGILKS
ncbi:MAG: rRNA methyltransferase [Candidatus Adlerbacteria bacterium]|nr:rRNA methyltransferase [Candidatus Adlerbacteria bacterium]